MKNTKETDTEDRKAVRTEYHFGGKHRTIYFSDGTSCNVYEDGYKSNSASISKTFSPDTMNTDTKVTKTKSAKASKVKASTTKVKKPTKKVDTDVAVAEQPVSPTPVTAKVSRADVKLAVENFLKNPPDKPLTLAQVYETMGFAHRQVYMMVREHGVPAGKTDAPGKGRKETLFTFNKVA